MMLSSAQLCFTVFVASFACLQVEVNSFRFPVSRHNKNIPTYESRFSDNTKCSWNCTIINSYFPKQWNSVLTSSRLIKVVVEYEKKVTKQCVIQASRNSSGNATEYLTVQLPENNKLSSFDQVIQTWFHLASCRDTEERIEAVCRFVKELRTPSEEAVFVTSKNSFIFPFVRNHLVDHGFLFVASDSNENHFTTAQEWLNDVLQLFLSVFCRAFVMHFLAVFCLFSPTLVTENGLRQIIVEGASPVSVRSLAGKYFHSECDSINRKAGKLILQLVVLPFAFLAPVAIALYYQQEQEKNRLFRFLGFDLPIPLVTVCVVCSVIVFIYSFFKSSFQGEPSLLSQIRDWLHIQPLILMMCRNFLYLCLIYYVQRSRFILPSRKRVSLLWCFRVVGFLVFLFTIPAVTIVLLVLMLVAVLVCLLIATPTLMALFDETNYCVFTFFFYRLPASLYTLFVVLFIQLAVNFGIVWILSAAVLGLKTIVGVALILLLSEESLSFVPLLVLVCSYWWNSYSSFTNKYHDLSLVLYKCYPKNRHDQIPNEAVENPTTDPAQTRSTPNSEKNYEMKIPEELFNMACDELMPIRKNVCKLVLKIFLILGFFFVVFALTTLLHAGATLSRNSLETFVTGLLPKIVAIYRADRGKEQTREATILEEKVSMIVQRYIKRTSSADQEQGKSVENTKEVTPAHGNEEAIQLYGEHGELVV